MIIMYFVFVNVASGHLEYMICTYIHMRQHCERVALVAWYWVWLLVLFSRVVNRNKIDYFLPSSDAGYFFQPSRSTACTLPSAYLVIAGI
jgi:hypothetical protein